MEVDNHMYEACKSTCHEWTSKDEVQNHKEDIAVEKDKLIMKKDRAELVPKTCKS